MTELKGLAPKNKEKTQVLNLIEKAGKAGIATAKEMMKNQP